MTNPETRAIANADTLSARARVFAFALLACLATTGILLLSVEDADFFDPTRPIRPPLIGISIPTRGFFLVAPLLVAGLYICLHIQIVKLRRTRANAPVAPRRGAGAGDARPVRRISHTALGLLLWAAGPLLLFGVWRRSMPAHDQWLTLLLAACLLASLYAGLSSWWAVAAGTMRGPLARAWKHPLALAAAGLVVAASLLGTERELTLDRTTPLVGRWLSDRTISTLVAADLVGVTMPLRLGDGKPATLDLTGRDLRRALARGVSMAGANLSGARLEHADLTEARLDGANFQNARLAGAYLPLARLDGARLNGADLRGTNLHEARLPGATLDHARAEGADLQGTDLTSARLRGTRLAGADLSETLLRGALIASADLSGANLTLAAWSGATNRHALVVGADLRGGLGLEQAHLNDSVGNAATLLPDTAAPDTGQPFHVPSCWTSPPDGFDAVLARFALCAPGEAPQKTGTACPLGTPARDCRAWALARGLVAAD